MTSERIKQIQETTAYPESVSVKNALLQVWNECGQEYQQQLSAERERAGKLVEDMQKLAWHLDAIKQYDLVEYIKQTLNEYEKES